KCAQLDAAKTSAEPVAEAEQVVENSGSKFPEFSTESQAREVATLEPEQQREVCQADDDTAPIPHIHLPQERQVEICLSCKLDECVNVTDPRCPIRIEQRVEWRRQNHSKTS